MDETRRNRRVGSLIARATVAAVAVLALGGPQPAVAGVAGAAPGRPRQPTLRPVEGITAFVGRLQAAMTALRAGDCPAVKRFADSSAFFLPCTDEGRARYADFAVIGYRQFATGAVIRFSSSSPTFPGGGVIGLVLDDSRRFVNVLTGRPRADEFSSPTARARFLFDRTASLFVRSLLTRACDLYFTTGYTFSLTKPVACRHEFSPPSERVRQLAADPHARPIRIGGTQTYQFYRLYTAGHYRTLVVGRVGRGTGSHSLYISDTGLVY